MGCTIDRNSVDGWVTVNSVDCVAECDVRRTSGESVENTAAKSEMHLTIEMDRVR